jgi:hypothetical protein
VQIVLILLVKSCIDSLCVDQGQVVIVQGNSGITKTLFTNRICRDGEMKCRSK